MGRGPSIENRKNAEDSRRGRLFTKLIREITVAARAGAVPDDNPRLRMAVDRALSSNMSKETVDRAIKRGSGAGDGAQLEEIRYEGYGAGGIAILVDCMTDNVVRTVAEVRHAFSKQGGNLGASGSVAYLFRRLGILRFRTPGDAEAERVLEVALEAAADDVQTADGWTEVQTAPEHFQIVRTALEAAGLNAELADVVLRPSTTISVDGEQAESVRRLLQALDELDDVQDVYSNAMFSGSEAAPR